MKLHPDLLCGTGFYDTLRHEIDGLVEAPSKRDTTKTVKAVKEVREDKKLMKAVGARLTAAIAAGRAR
jgi:hypothetical protein